MVLYCCCFTQTKASLSRAQPSCLHVCSATNHLWNLISDSERDLHGAKLNHCVPLPHRHSLHLHGPGEGEGEGEREGKEEG